MPEEFGSVVKIFSSIDDPRKARGKRHRLIDIFVMSVFGMLIGHTDFYNMVDDLHYYEDYFTELLGLKHGIPSHDVFSAVFRAIDPRQFTMCFIEWVYSLSTVKDKHLCFDGKAVRAACDKIHGKNIPYIVNAFLSDNGLIIGQLRVDEKSNEIKGIPELMDMLDLKGVTVSIDAIGCQKSITDKIVKEKHGDYVIATKANQEKLQEGILSYFETNIPEYEKEIEKINKYSKENVPYIPSNLFNSMSFYETFDSGHGRIEKRKYYVTDDIYFIDKEKWDTVKAVGITVNKRIPIIKNENDEVVNSKEPEPEIRAYILSRKMSAEEFSDYARGHWAIENSLHYVLDNQYMEDRSKANGNHSMENLSLLRKIVFNLTVLTPEVKGKSKKSMNNYYRHNNDKVMELLFKKIPENYVKARECVEK